MRLLVPFIAIALLLCACNEPRVPPTLRGEALRDRTVREVKVVKIWDQGTDRVSSDGDPHVSHFIEVDVVSGPDAGQQLTLPYDEWNVGKKPPARGITLVMSPADWVQRDPQSQGRPYGDW